jgi:hypothetical protein
VTGIEVGKTPMQTFIDTLPVVKVKLTQAA